MKLSLAEARAIALAAQQLASARPADDQSLPRPSGRGSEPPYNVDATALHELVRRLGVVQIDSVNVLVRSHYLPAWSRLGAYDRDVFDNLSRTAPRALFEYWGHEASLLPVELHPMLRWRMARAGETAWRHVREIGKRRKAFVARVLAAITERGPLRAAEIEKVKPKKSGWWEWSDVKTAIEWLFWSGQVTSATRRGFERVYDLPSRVLPAEVLALPTPSEPDAQRGLIEIAARALGVATETDLREYFHMKGRSARTAVATLVEAGTLVPVTIDGWPAAYLHRDAENPKIDRTRAALISPFDSLIFYRERAERLFGMRYRIEIYTPQPKRVYGYYVLPFLLGDTLVARVDLKADRANGALLVQAAHREPTAPKATAAALAKELVALAGWLGLERVEILGGDLAPALRLAMPRAVQQPRRR